MNLNAIKKLREQLSKVHYKCKENCFECCSLVPIYEDELRMMKKELLKNGFKEPPNGKGNDYCEWLTVDGKCSVYNQRPIICRSFNNIKYVLKIGNKSTLTQSCTYGDGKEVNATSEFINYGKYIYNKGILIGSKEILKNMEIL